jgi:hypothetical protein
MNKPFSSSIVDSLIPVQPLPMPSGNVFYKDIQSEPEPFGDFKLGAQLKNLDLQYGCLDGERYPDLDGAVIVDVILSGKSPTSRQIKQYWKPKDASFKGFRKSTRNNRVVLLKSSGHYHIQPITKDAKMIWTIVQSRSRMLDGQVDE